MKFLSILGLSLALTLPQPSLFSHIGSLSPAKTAAVQSYNNSSLYEIQFPSDWVLEETIPEYLIVRNQELSQQSIAKQSPKTLIQTNIYLTGASFEDSIHYQGRAGSTKVSQTSIEINGMPAQRSSFTNLSSDFNDLIITTIRYSPTETVMMASFYNSSNDSAKSDIIALHDSFQKP